MRPPGLLGRALRPLVSPPVFDFWAHEFGSTASHGRVIARIVGKRAESSRAMTLELLPNRHFQGFRPGQHLNLSVDVEGRRLTRSYSLTGLPQADGRLSLTVQKVEAGVVSTHLFARARVGDLVELGQPFGGMTLPEALPNKLLLLAAGSGITPLMSLTRELGRRRMPAETTLIYWARHRADLCFLSELRALAAREPTFHFRVALTGDAATGADELRGRPSPALFGQAVPDLAARSVYACGPAGFVSQIESVARPVARGFQSETFTPRHAAPLDSQATVCVTLARSKRVLTVRAGEPLLAALEAQGIRPKSGCRMGICNTCACGKREGLSRNLKNGGESAEPEAHLRICISSAQSDLTLDL